VFPRHSKADLAVASHGDGCFIVDKSGKRYLDASGGAAVSCLGHSDDTVRKAIIEQTEKLAFAHTSFFTSEPAEALADLLVTHAPEGISRAYFVSSGSEAVEAALKLAKQYYV
jgi:adenosylmethionine-8-amino-7-oxononanoate aminotransferase